MHSLCLIGAYIQIEIQIETQVETQLRGVEWGFFDGGKHDFCCSGVRCGRVVAPNPRYFLLEYLIDQSVRPDKIIYNGSKIMYMTVERDLHIKVYDSLNFLPMKLSKLSETFGLTELKKGWFPHYFNTRDNQTYAGSYPEPRYYEHDFMSEK